MLTWVIVGALWSGPELVEPAASEPVSAPASELDEAAVNRRRSADHYRLAIQHHEEGRLQEACVSILHAYRLLPEGKLGEQGKVLILAAVDYHVDAYSKTRDPVRLAAIQPELERFVADYQGFGPEVDELRRHLNWIRSERILVSYARYRRKEYRNAAIEAAQCYDAIMQDDRGLEIAGRAAVAASVAYRKAWSDDGDVRHLLEAERLLSDHIEQASEPVRAVRVERRALDRDQLIAKARGGGVENLEDARDVGVVTSRDRTLAMGAGAGLGGGVMLSIGGALAGPLSIMPPNESTGRDKLVVSGRHLGPAISMGVVGAVASGLAMHSLIQGGLVSPRARKIVAIAGTVVGLVGVGVGASLIGYGHSGSQNEGASQAGLGLTLGVTAPLGVGLSALLSHRGDG